MYRADEDRELLTVIEKMKPATRDLVLSFVGAIALLILLAAADGRLRDVASDATPVGVARELSTGAARLRAAAITVRDVVVDHGTMTAFVVAATVLVACMLRT